MTARELLEGLQTIPEGHLDVEVLVSWPVDEARAFSATPLKAEILSLKRSDMPKADIFLQFLMKETIGEVIQLYKERLD